MSRNNYVAASALTVCRCRTHYASTYRLFLSCELKNSNSQQKVQDLPEPCIWQRSLLTKRKPQKMNTAYDCYSTVIHCYSISPSTSESSVPVLPRAQCLTMSAAVENEIKLMKPEPHLALSSRLKQAREPCSLTKHCFSV